MLRSGVGGLEGEGRGIDVPGGPILVCVTADGGASGPAIKIDIPLEISSYMCTRMRSFAPPGADPPAGVR